MLLKHNILFCGILFIYVSFFFKFYQHMLKFYLSPSKVCFYSVQNPIHHYRQQRRNNKSNFFLLQRTISRTKCILCSLIRWVILSVIYYVHHQSTILWYSWMEGIVLYRASSANLLCRFIQKYPSRRNTHNPSQLKLFL